jgi:hypothetical protein
MAADASLEVNYHYITFIWHQVLPSSYWVEKSASGGLHLYVSKITITGLDMVVFSPSATILTVSLGWSKR